MRHSFTERLIVVLGTFVVLGLLVTQPVISGAEKEVKRTTNLMAKLLSGMVIYSLYEEDVQRVVKEVISDVGFPIVITDQYGIPRAWEGIGVNPNMFTQSQLNMPQRLKNDPYFIKILKAIQNLKEVAKPIPIKKGDLIVGYLYYGYPHVLSYMRILPFALMLIALITFILFYTFARSIHVYEIETIWVNFAKGLAHQMGTPVSALFAWLELLKEEDVPDYIIENMTHDVERLKAILLRFSRVGGAADFKEHNIKSIIEDTISMLRERFLKNIKIELILQDVYLSCDRELISWALENLIKNAYEARSNYMPTIEIRNFVENDECVIRITDNGKGIEPQYRKKLFRESFTTKKRGWGVGLLLTRRIIEDIHHGKIRLVRSERGVETIFEIRLPL